VPSSDAVMRLVTRRITASLLADARTVPACLEINVHQVMSVRTPSGYIQLGTNSHQLPASPCGMVLQQKSCYM